MLSVQPLKSAEGAADYYTAAFNYYSGDATAMRWMGKGSEHLKLEGIVEKEQMLSLMKGEVPGGQRLKNPKGEHRPGFDMTFSAPKSVSILVGLGVTPDMITYHDKAVEMAVSQIEAEFAEARVLREGVMQFEKTGNLTIAAFRQPSSRANDPALHTHCVVMNMTFLNGKAKSLSSDIHGEHGVVEQLQRNVAYAGLLYRHHLANTLKENGYSLRLAGDGLFEIDGIPPDVLRHYSQRREEIEQCMKDKGWSGAKSSSSATLLTREGKEELSLDVLEAEWKARANELGFDAQAFVNQRFDRIESKNWFQTYKDKLFNAFYKPVAREEQDAREAVTVAIETLSQKTSVFNERALKAESLKHTLLSERVVTQRAIDTTILNKKNDQSLYEARCPYSNKVQLTTPWLLTLEAETIARVDANKGVVPAMATIKEVNEFQKNVDSTRTHPLTHSQKQAMMSLLTSKDRFIAIQGYAGVAKTTMLNVARDMITEKGYTLRGITVASSAASEMRNKAGIQSDVFPIVHSELKRARDHSLQNTVFIVDEASMLSSPQGHELAKLVEQKGARLCFVGDEAQLPSVKNGRIFGLIQDYDVHTSVMDEIVRQRNQRAKESVEHATRGEVYDALQCINDVRELATHEERIAHVAHAWLNLSTDVRKRTLLFAPTHANRADITALIRDGLEKESVLTGPAWTQTVLRARPLEDIQQRFAGHYQSGNIIRFNQDFKRASIATGDYFEVGQITAEHRRNNVLPLLRENGKTVSFKLNQLPEYKTHTAGFSRIMEVYETKTLDIKQGETILWCRNFKQEGIHNSERASVITIHETSIDLLLDNGSQLSLDKGHAALKHVDHGYVFTNFKVQGKDAHYGIGLIESYHQFSATLKNFYVQISRAVNNMTVITDSKQNLVRALELNDDEKKSAIDAISSTQLNAHTTRFSNTNRAPMDSVLDKKLMKDKQWGSLEKQLDNYQLAKRTQNTVHASLSAHNLLSNPDGIKMANSRLGFNYKTYRNDAMKVASHRLQKELNDDEKEWFNMVKQYVDLNQSTANAWKQVRENSPLAALSNNRDKAVSLSAHRDQLAFAISQNVPLYKPFLNHFSIGELNRFGVPQYRYEEEGLQSIKRLDKLSEQAARHQLNETVKQFFQAEAVNKGELASLIVAQAKTAHSYVLAYAKQSNIESQDLWRNIRFHARELKDDQYRQTLTPKQQNLFDTVKQYKQLSFEVSQHWKSAFKAQENGQPLSPEVVKPIDALNKVKHQLAHAISIKDPGENGIFTYFNLDGVQISKQSNVHEQETRIALFLKPMMNFKEQLTAARFIAEDIKGHYPIIKKMGVDRARLNRFMKIATRAELINQLSEPEKQYYKQVTSYQYAAKQASAAWTSWFNAKQQSSIQPSMTNALQRSALRDAYAFKIQDIASFGLALNHEKIAIPRLEEHAKNHHDRLREIKHLQECYHSQLQQFSEKNAVTSINKKLHWKSQWHETNKQIKAIQINPAYQYAIAEYPVSLMPSKPVAAILESIPEYELLSKPSNYTKNNSSRHNFNRLDASSINDILMTNPVETYTAIFGEPKRVSNSIIEYSGGLKVSIKGSKSGLWNHFGEMKGGAPIQAIMHANNVTFKEALVIASSLCGERTFNELNTIKKSIEPQLSSDESKAKAQLSAQSIWKGTEPLANSLAETYLKTHRGIAEISGLKDMRYWPVGAKWKKLNEEGVLVESVNKIPALVIAARNSEQQISAVQRIYLDKNTGNKNKFMLEAKRAKLSCGVMKGSAGMIQKGNANGRIYIAEGPETAASVAMADPKSTVFVSFGVNNIANLSGVISRLNPRDVVIAADNDHKNDIGKSSKDTTEIAAKALRDTGIKTLVIYPKSLEENRKTDWNDVLIKDGVESIRKQLGLTKPEMSLKTIKDINRNINIKNTNYSLPDKNMVYSKNTGENSLSVLAKEYTSYMGNNKINNPILFNKQTIDLRELNLSVSGVLDSKSQCTLKSVSKISEKPMIKEMEI
jgi:conjugative transfer relaxase protein TraI